MSDSYIKKDVLATGFFTIIATISVTHPYNKNDDEIFKPKTLTSCGRLFINLLMQALSLSFWVSWLLLHLSQTLTSTLGKNSTAQT